MERCGPKQALVGRLQMQPEVSFEMSQIHTVHASKQKSLCELGALWIREQQYQKVNRHFVVGSQTPVLYIDQCLVAGLDNPAAFWLNEAGSDQDPGFYDECRVACLAEENYDDDAKQNNFFPVWRKRSVY
ncbi:hypothetical protein GCM10011396_00930 [Undibacterium terreum]|uniref:Uncharacterized protein n=2 Tax=Undibacterium terreum TaxID=1224302 RepID=A0A916U2T7_9BURK|nr:hypothetical protein GCM10011396_00930 [Undibacterium terreum]